MSIYAIADLHLSFDERVEKPMDVFGKRWEGHADRLKENWITNIRENDHVLIAGDISWALKMEEAMPDLDFIHSLPGKKIMIRGNHELWWQSISRLNKLYDDIYFLQNKCYLIDNLAICGTRGWICPGSDDFDENDEKIYQRELLRLEMSLEDAKLAGAREIIGMLHYPPTNDKKQISGFTKLFEKYGAKQVIYGHLHGSDVWSRGLQSVLNGVEYRLVSLDYLDACPIKIKNI